MRSVPPDAVLPDAVGVPTVDARRGRVQDLEGEVARLTLRVKDL